MQPDASERPRFYAAVSHLLSEIGKSRPVALVLDDLHCADGDTLSLLSYLVRAAASMPWLIIGTYREDQAPVGNRFHRWSTSLIREELCRRVYLPRLNREECGSLVRALLSSALEPSAVSRGATQSANRAPSLVTLQVADLLYELSLGNPLFVHDLIEAMKGRGD